MSVRDDLVAAVQAVVPAGTRVVPYQDQLDVPDAIVVMFKQLQILPLAAAPRSGRFDVRYVLTVTAEGIDPLTAEADLDAFVVQLLSDLDPLDWFAWTSADKVMSNSRMAYDIACWNIAH